MRRFVSVLGLATAFVASGCGQTAATTATPAAGSLGPTTAPSATVAATAAPTQIGAPTGVAQDMIHVCPAVQADVDAIIGPANGNDPSTSLETCAFQQTNGYLEVEVFKHSGNGPASYQAKVHEQDTAVQNGVDAAAAPVAGVGDEAVVFYSTNESPQLGLLLVTRHGDFVGTLTWVDQSGATSVDVNKVTPLMNKILLLMGG